MREKSDKGELFLFVKSTSSSKQNVISLEVYLKRCQTSMMKFFLITNKRRLLFLRKSCMTDVR